MARRFFYACAGLLCVAFIYHLGATSATAQAPGNPIVVVTDDKWVYLANGDVFRPNSVDPANYTRTGNVFGSPTPAKSESFGSVKARYR